MITPPGLEPYMDGDLYRVEVDEHSVETEYLIESMYGETVDPAAGPSQE